MATLSVAARNAALNAVVAYLETGAAAGIIFAARNSVGSVLCNAPFPVGAFGAASAGRVELTLPFTTTCNVAGTVSDWVLFGRGGSVDVIGSASVSAGGGEIEFFPSLAWLVGQRWVINLAIEMA